MSSCPFRAGKLPGKMCRPKAPEVVDFRGDSAYTLGNGVNRFAQNRLAKLDIFYQVEARAGVPFC
jgi:hypothetical protein